MVLKIALKFQLNFDQVLLILPDKVKRNTFAPLPIENGIEQIILIFELSNILINHSFYSLRFIVTYAICNLHCVQHCPQNIKFKLQNVNCFFLFFTCFKNLRVTLRPCSTSSLASESLFLKY